MSFYRKEGGVYDLSKKLTLGIPSGEDFIGDKDIDDRLYSYMLLHSSKGFEKGTRLFQKAKLRGAYKETGTCYRTLLRKLGYLVSGGYVIEFKEVYELGVKGHKYKKYICRDTLSKLYLTGEKDIIKLYIYLSSLYTQYKTAAYFTYNSLVGVLGYSSYKNNRKRKDIIRLLETLRDIKLINYVLDTKEQRFAKFRVIEIGG